MILFYQSKKKSLNSIQKLLNPMRICKFYKKVTKFVSILTFFFRLFGTKCDKCGSSFSKNDFVMRAKSKIYHIDCFRCCACARQLVPGDEFALRDSGALYCKEDHDVMEKSTTPSTPHQGQESNNNTSINNNNHNSNNSTELGCMSGEFFDRNY